MASTPLTDHMIQDRNDPLKIRNVRLGTAYDQVKALETLPGFATPFMSLHEDFSLTPFDIRYRYHNQQGAVQKIVVDVAQFLKREKSTDVLDATFSALSSFYTRFFGEHRLENEACTYQEGIRHVWTEPENGNATITLDLGYEDDGDRIKVLRLLVQST